MEHYKQRLLGTSGASGSAIPVLRSTVLNPWQIETSTGSLFNILEAEFCQAVTEFSVALASVSSESQKVIR